MEVKIEISNNLKQRIDSITEKPIEEFCLEAVEETARIIIDDLRLSCA